MSDPAVELECVRRLYAVCERPFRDAQALSRRPGPDVLAISPDGARVVFEVTELHPDDAAGEGSAARAAEAKRAKQNPGAAPEIWVQTEFMLALCHRIKEKIRKAPEYVVLPGETLSLLLVASLASLDGAAATFVIPQFVALDQLNAATNEMLSRSLYQHAYLDLQLSGNAVYEWSRATGWRRAAGVRHG